MSVSEEFELIGRVLSKHINICFVIFFFFGFGFFFLIFFFFVGMGGCLVRFVVSALEWTTEGCVFHDLSFLLITMRLTSGHERFARLRLPIARAQRPNRTKKM